MSYQQRARDCTFHLTSQLRKLSRAGSSSLPFSSAAAAAAAIGYQLLATGRQLPSEVLLAVVDVDLGFAYPGVGDGLRQGLAVG